MATVYQIQNPVRHVRDTSTGEVLRSEPAYDVASAWEFGEVVVMLPIGNRALSPTSLVKRLRSKLIHFTDEDSILGIGDPVSIGVAVALAATFNNGNVHVLRWNKTLRIYERQLYNIAGDNYGNA